MKTWLAFRNSIAILAAMGLAVLVIAILVQAGATRFIVPSPEITGVEFVRSVGAHRIEGALNMVSTEIDPEGAAQKLEEIIQQMEDNHRGIDSVQGLGENETGPTAAARIHVSLDDGTEKELTFPLIQEKGLWKITSIEPLEELAR